MKPPVSVPLRALALLPLLAMLAGCSILGGKPRDPVTIYAPDIRVPARADWPAAAEEAEVRRLRFRSRRWHR